jgi:uncharacterized protein YndB with AHSA1/START domain
MQRALRFDVDYPHPPAKVWRVLTTREHLAAWLMPNDFEPRVGHRFQFRSKPMGGWDGIVNCEVLELVPERRLVITWVSNVIDTKVTFLLEPAGPGTRLTLLHTGFTGMKGVMTSFLLGMGWKGIVRKGIPNLLTKLSQEGRIAG